MPQLLLAFVDLLQIQLQSPQWCRTDVPSLEAHSCPISRIVACCCACIRAIVTTAVPAMRRWANSLRRLPHAFLWLTRVSVRKDTSLYAEQYLRHESLALGLPPDRLAFSFRFPEQVQFSARKLAREATSHGQRMHPMPKPLPYPCCHVAKPH